MTTMMRLLLGQMAIIAFEGTARKASILMDDVALLNCESKMAG